MPTTDLITLDDVQDALLTGKAIEINTPEDVAADIVRRVLEADTFEDAVDSLQSVPATDIDGEVIQVKAIAWLSSTQSNGPSVYALMQVFVPSLGRTVAVSIGGLTVMAILLRAQRDGKLPLWCVLHKRPSTSDPTRSVWTFRPAEPVE